MGNVLHTMPRLLQVTAYYLSTGSYLTDLSDDLFYIR